MQIIPNFTEEQQAFVVESLIQRTPARRIAKAFRQLYPDFAIEVDDEQCEQAFIDRCYQYAHRKDRKWYQIIKDGRANYEHLEEANLLYKRPEYRQARREALIERIADLDVRINYSDVDEEKKFKLEQGNIKLELQVLSEYDKLERMERGDEDDDGEDDGPTEDDFPPY